MPERCLNGHDLVEIERLRRFLLPALVRRGWTDLSDITNAVFVERLRILFEGAMNFVYGTAETPDGGETIVVFLVRSHLGENGKPMRFVGRAESKTLAFLRAAEEIACDDNFRQDLLGR
jgi:hypothetical protein